MSYQIIRASEIGEYVYCHRAWWLKRVGGRVPIPTRELTHGTSYHRSHGRIVQRARWGQRFALLILFLAVTLIAYWLVNML